MEPTNDQIAARKHELTQEAFQAILDGTIGTGRGGGGPRGPKLSELETILRDLAGEEILGVLVKQGLATKTEAAYKAADGKAIGPKSEFKIGAEVFTFAQLIDRRLAGPNGDRLRKEAQRELDRRAKRVAGVAERLEEL